MNAIWARAAVTLVVAALAAFAAALWHGPQAGWMTLALLLGALFLYNTIALSRLWRALDAPSYGEVPSALGVWGEVFYRLHRLVRRWHEQVNEGARQHRRFIEALQASPNGVIMLDDQHRIEWCNATAESHLEIDASRDQGQHINYLVRVPAFLNYLFSEHYEAPLVLSAQGGSHRILSIQVFPYGENHKLVLSADITDLEKADAMRRDFVANVSHELKTPLTVLSGFLETVRELRLPQTERTRYLDIMAQQSSRMQHLVDDLLVLARIEGDSRPPAEVTVDVPEIVARLVDDAIALSAGKHLVETEIDPGLTVRGSAQELVSAFGNLVNNAVRYTPPDGKICIRWQLQGEQAAFSVSDNGIGIPAEHIPRLTERFYRVDSSRSRETGGTGLGLAIVKHVLQRHNARLHIDSMEGRGSTFIALFPTLRTQRASAPPVRAAS